MNLKLALKLFAIGIGRSEELSDSKVAVKFQGNGTKQMD